MSTTEAEYVVLGEGVREAMFTGAVLSFICPSQADHEFGFLWITRGALTKNLLSPARSKHIDVRFHFVRELLRSQRIDVQYVVSEEQHADIMTKSLGATPSKSHRRFLLDLPLEGGYGL